MYEATGAVEFVEIDMTEIGGKLGFDDATTERVVQYLMREGLLTGYLGGGVSITHEGIREVEDAVSNPARPTMHFPAVNLIHIEAMNNSQIMQGSMSSTQTQNIAITKNDLSQIEAFIREYRAHFSELKFTEEQREEAESALQTAEIQLKSKKPNAPILKITLQNLAALLTHTGAILLAEGIMHYFPQLFR